MSKLSNAFKRYKKEFPEAWKLDRDELVKRILSSETPNWGSINLIMTKEGI